MNKHILQYEPLIDRKQLSIDFSQYLEKNVWLTEFKKTREFENKIAKFLNISHCHAVNNGTISLSIALLVCGVKPGDEVIVPAISMIATANSVKLLGATPVFADVESENLCLNFKNLPITNKTKAIIYVSLNGRSHDLTKLFNFCNSKNIYLIEDSAQSFGSKYQNNKNIGTCSHISSFSFSSPKIITTGQGGCLCTDDDTLSDKIIRLKDFGRTQGGLDLHETFGINSKFTDLQAVVGLNQLKTLSWRIKRKKFIYSEYYKNLNNTVKFLFTPQNIVPWFVDIYVENRKELQQYLKKNNIETRSIYPSITQQKCYKISQNFSIADIWCSKGLWLPSSLNILTQDIQYICNLIKRFYGK